MTMLEETHTGQSKIERYKWVTRDRKGEFSYIEKTRLQVDQVYQRQIAGDDKVLEIAREWSWIACGAISVALRPDGSLFIMDGQHRVAGALRRSDIHDLPCMVFRIGDIKTEAEGFLSTNTLRKPLSSVARFRALLTKEDPAALAINDMLLSDGRTFEPKHNGITGLAFLIKEHRQGRFERLYDIFPLISRLHEGACVMEMTMQALCWIEDRLLPVGQSVIDPRWRNRLLAIGIDELIESARKAAHFHGRGNGPVYADGFLTRMNRGLSKKFELPK